MTGLLLLNILNGQHTGAAYLPHGHLVPVPSSLRQDYIKQKRDDLTP